MKDILHSICLVIAVAGFIILLRELVFRRARADEPADHRPDPSLLFWAGAFLASALSFLLTLSPVWRLVDQLLGVPNIAALIGQSCVMILLGFQMTVLAHWKLSTEAASSRILEIWIAVAGIVAGLTILFFLLTPAVQRPVGFTLYYVHDPYYQAYLTLYITAYATGEILLARACWNYAANSSDAWVSRGLRTVAVGAVITLGYSGIRIASIIGGVLDLDLGLDRFESLAWLCADIGAALALAGFFLPALGLSWVRDHIDYWRLRTLWQALDRQDLINSIAPFGTPLTRRLRIHDASTHLYWRTRELRDGMDQLLRFVDPGLTEIATAQRQTEGLGGEDLAAAVTADQIRQALAAHRDWGVGRANSELEYRAEWALTALDTQLTTPYQEADVLLKVATYYARSSTAPATTAALHR